MCTIEQARSFHNRPVPRPGVGGNAATTTATTTATISADSTRTIHGALQRAPLLVVLLQAQIRVLVILVLLVLLTPIAGGDAAGAEANRATYLK